MRSIRWRTLSLAAWVASGEKHQLTVFSSSGSLICREILAIFRVPMPQHSIAFSLAAPTLQPGSQHRFSGLLVAAGRAFIGAALVAAVAARFAAGGAGFCGLHFLLC